MEKKKKKKKPQVSGDSNNKLFNLRFFLFGPGLPTISKPKAEAISLTHNHKEGRQEDQA